MTNLQRKDLKGNQFGISWKPKKSWSKFSLLKSQNQTAQSNSFPQRPEDTWKSQLNYSHLLSTDPQLGNKSSLNIHEGRENLAI